MLDRRLQMIRNEGHFRSSSGSSKKLLHNAIRKYGRELFTSEIIWWSKDKASLDVSEDSFIKVSAKRLATMAIPEVRAKRIATLKATLALPEVKAKRKKTDLTPETFARRSAVHTGVIWINNGVRNCQIKLDQSIPSGWSAGFLGAFGNSDSVKELARMRGRHTRWHTNRGITKSGCPLCEAAVLDSKET